MTLHLQTRLRINLSENPTPFSFGSDNFRQSFVPQLTSNSLTPKRGPDSSQTPWIGVGRRIGRLGTLLRCSDAGDTIEVVHLWAGSGNFWFWYCVCACSTKLRLPGLGQENPGWRISGCWRGGGSDWETGTPLLCGCVPRHRGRQRKNEQKKKKQTSENKKQAYYKGKIKMKNPQCT